MRKKTLNVGVIGLGVGEKQAEGFHNHPRTNLVALCDTNPIKLQMTAQRWPDAKLFDDPFDLIKSGLCDVVAIASPDDCHYDQICAALDADLHTFAEKPLTINAAHTKDIQDKLSQKPHLRLISNTLLRKSPRFEDLKNRVNNQELGDIYHIEADYNYGRLWKLTEGWRGEIEGYSVILGGAIHMVDLVLWLKGGMRPQNVYAIGTGIGTSSSDFKGYDTVMSLLEFPDGSIAKIGANFSCVEPHFHRFLVYGTKATFENQPQAANLFVSREKDSQAISLETGYPNVEKDALVSSFIETIFDNTHPVITEQEVFDAMFVCHAINDSLKRKAKITIEYPTLSKRTPPFIG